MEADSRHIDTGAAWPIKACLFDLDGVLVDTAVYHYKAWKRLAALLNIDFTEAQNEELKGVSRMDSLKKILQWGGIERSGEDMLHLATIKNEWYVAMISEMTPAEVLPGTVAFLTAIRKAGYFTALGSASKNSALILERTHLAHFFDAIVDGNTVQRSKPDPEVFLTGAKLLKVTAAACLVFEDAVAGVKAAKNAGMRAIGIGSAEILTEADLVVSGLDKLDIKILKEIEAGRVA